MTDPEKTEDVEEALEFLDKMEVIAEMTGKAHLYPDRIDSLRDTIRTLRERLEEVEWAEIGERYWRRRADRLEEAHQEIYDLLNGTAHNPPDDLCQRTLRKVSEIVAAALDSREDEGESCTCPRYGSQHGWDPICPRHAVARSEWCDYEDHVPGQRDYGFTDRGGRKRLCAKCEAPLEIHEDDGGKYTEGWHGEKTDQPPVHADEPEGDERSVFCKCGHPTYCHVATGISDDGYRHGECQACDECSEFRPTDEPVSREGEDGTFQTTRHLVPVTSDTVRCEVPWDWLDWSDVHLDPGFPDDSGRYREGYFKVRTSHAPAEYDPHNVVVRARCAVGPSDYWEQEPDPEEGYEPPPSSFRGEPIHEVTPAKDAHGMPWWIIVTRQDTGATHADARSGTAEHWRSRYRQAAREISDLMYVIEAAEKVVDQIPAYEKSVVGELSDALDRLSDAPSGEKERDGYESERISEG